MALAGDIEALDYNTIRAKIIEVMGTGLGTYGYGQSIVSNSVSSGNTITAAQWTGLRFDIINAIIHQTGSLPLAVIVNTGTVIDDRASDPVVNYNTLTNLARENRFDLAPSQSVTSAIGSPKTYTSNWSSLASLTCTMTFNDAIEARYFFNSGGNVKITTTRIGGSATLQNQSWTDLLSEAGTQLFKALPSGTIQNVTNISSPDVDRISGTYIGLEGTSSGSGIGQLFNITISDTGSVSVSIVNSGTGHTTGDTITISDNQLGNGGAADLTFDVIVNPAGASYYTLTDEYQIIYELSSSAAYADNTYRISAKCDVENNNTGTATEVDIKIELIDSYIDPDIVAGFSANKNLPIDQIDGTITITLEEQKASGTLQPIEVVDGGPTGNFSISSPSYVVSNITAS